MAVDYSQHYNETSFWDKVKRFAQRAGSKVLQAALTLYYALQDADTPAWARTVIIGALGYFVWPADAIPDAVPAAGFADDLGALTVALGIVAAHIKREHLERARRKVHDWFDDEDEDGPRD